MPNWKFWESSSEPPPRLPESEAPSFQFRVKPRTDLLRPASDTSDGGQISRLLRQREAVLFDVEQAEAAQSDENPWQARVALLDGAIRAVRADRDRTRAVTQPPGRELPPTPIEQITFAGVPAPSVSFRIANQLFRYEEAIDWAERGFQLARSELELVAGDPDPLIPAGTAETERSDLLQHLMASLFVFATDIRDRAINDLPLPPTPSLADLARPDTEAGGWFDWLGHSPAAARKERILREYNAEEQRLLGERERELSELAKWQDRLPIAKRRLADVDAAIAALVGKS